MQRKRPPLEFWLWLGIIGMIGVMVAALSLAPRVSVGIGASSLSIHSK